jgi:hypothetical protein
VTSGVLVVPPGPGATPVLSADTMSFTRPIFEYAGTAPWQIHDRPTETRQLAGYASRPSYLPGDTLQLAVSTTAPAYEVTIWRVSGSAPASSPFEQVEAARSQPGLLQGAPIVDPVTRIVAARWDYTFSFAIPPSWRSGVYLARLSSTEGVQSYVPFVIRSASVHRILVVSNALNWQAYNTWGGSSLYETRVGEPLPGLGRALGVSFDRPYVDDGGAGQLFFLELPLIAWLERQGLDVAYTTDYDLSLAPDAQPLPKVIVFNGHGEYWGVPLYAWLDRHVNEVGDLGLAMLAGDSGYWPVSFFHEAPGGPRDFLGYKNGPVPASLLPAGATAPPTGSLEPGESAQPSGEPDVEERAQVVLGSFPPTGPYIGSFAGEPLFGVRYGGVTTVLGRYSLQAAGADPRLFDATGLAPGDSLGFIAGGEVDKVYPFLEWWGPLGGRYDHLFAEAAEIPGRGTWRWTADAVWRELPQGGRVFSAGTFYWGWELDPTWGPEHQVPPGFGRLTLNILQFLAGPG